MTGTKAFVDTNILVYSVDQRDLRKLEVAQRLLRELTINGDGVISGQVTQEFSVTLISKLRYTPSQVGEFCAGLSDLEFIAPSFQTTIDALRIMERWQLSFWDSLLFAAAKDAGCEILYTEDLSHRQVIEGIRIINPFLP